MAAKAKKGGKAKSAAKSKVSAAEYVVRSRVKELIAGAGCQSSGDVADAVGSVVVWYLEQAVARAKANGRKTVRSHDVIACC